MAPKLTETFNDKIKTNGAFPAPIGSVRIVPAHEPTKSNPDFIPPGVILGSQATEQSPQVAPVAEPEPLKVALVGTAPSSRMLAPFNDTSWKIWGCSPGNMNVLPRVDVWFELHGNLLWEENKNYGAPYIEWLKRLNIPVFMQDQRYIPHAQTFPMKEMVKEFGPDFFTSSFAWMMAFAIHSGAKEIALYGIDMASRDEYILQRPGFFFFRHMARQRGIKVSAPHESDIMQPPGLYGYSDVTPMGRKILAREKELRDRVNGMRGEMQRLHENLKYLEGALEDIDYFKSIWMGQGSAELQIGGSHNG